MIELEKTYLVKHIPSDLSEHAFQEIEDTYVLEKNKVLKLRIRKKQPS